MKIAITPEAKKWITVADMPIVRRIIETMKEDDGLKEYALIAIRAAVEGAGKIELFTYGAEICGNSRAWNEYSCESKHFDIWITAKALTDKGFVIIGANLTDIWRITGYRGEDYKYVKHMSVRFFREVKA